MFHSNCGPMYTSLLVDNRDNRKTCQNKESGDLVENLVTFTNSLESGDFVKNLVTFTKSLKAGDFVKNLVSFTKSLESGDFVKIW